jgi:rubredoxin
MKLSSMERYQCQICAYIYDPAEGDPSSGIKPGTPFKDLPDDYVCPLCSAGKEEFFPCD